MQSKTFTTLLATALLASCLHLANSLECYRCYSFSSDTCITAPNAQEAVTCADTVTSCGTYQAANNTLIRDCLATCPADATSCQICTGDKCNSNLVCENCQGQQDCSEPTKLPATLAVCSSEQTACLTQLNDNSTISRSCGVATACTDATKCTSCTTGQCNNALFPADRVRCYTCSGDSCNTVNNDTLTACGLNSGKCYTIGTSATTMQRGCTSDADTKCTADTTDANCLLCNNETGCNNLTYSRDGGSCVTCDSCAAQQETSAAKACEASNYTQAVGCFTQTKDNVVSRGCLNALAYGVTCSSEAGCTSCTGSNCNVDLVQVDETFKCLRCSNIDNDKCTTGEVTGTACANQTAKECFYGKWGDLVVRDCWDEASDLMQYQCVQGLYSCKKCETSDCNNVSFGSAGLIQISLGLLMASMSLIFIQFV